MSRTPVAFVKLLFPSRFSWMRLRYPNKSTGSLAEDPNVDPVVPINGTTPPDNPSATAVLPSATDVVPSAKSVDPAPAQYETFVMPRATLVVPRALLDVPIAASVAPTSSILSAGSIDPVMYRSDVNSPVVAPSIKKAIGVVVPHWNE
jgi:hypothetical protein